MQKHCLRSCHLAGNNISSFEEGGVDITTFKLSIQDVTRPLSDNLLHAIVHVVLTDTKIVTLYKVNDSHQPDNNWSPKIIMSF